MFLKRMSEEEYVIARNVMIKNLTDAFHENEQAKSESYKKAEQEQDQLLPNGISTDGHFLYSIFEESSKKIGYIWFGLVKRNYGNVAFIFDFLIYEQYRGLGYGKKTMLVIEEEIKEARLNKIELYVSHNNPVARNVYQESGFKSIRGNDEGDVYSKIV